MRAVFPSDEGFAGPDGARTHYEIYGEGETTVLLIPAFPITHSRSWKGQISHLSRHYRLVTLDGIGNGRSDRVTDPAGYSDEAMVELLGAVLDASATNRAILVAHCNANSWVLQFTHRYPDRVRGWVAVEPGVPYLGETQPHYVEALSHWEEIPENPQAWELANRHVWLTDTHTWLDFFFGALLVEPHSTKQHEDMVGWAMETTGEVLVAAQEAESPTREQVEAMVRGVRCPVLVVHGTEDLCQSVLRGRVFAEMAGAHLVEIEGAGHLTPGREPVKVNLAIKEFVDRIEGVPMRSHTWTRGLNRRKKALYVSSPIGLGHARRDVAIAKELKKLEPDLEIDWLAQDPVTRVLEAEGETLHPASEWLASESAHFTSEATGHDLHCFQALRRMDEILVANFMIFQEVMEEGLYDLAIGDEAWDIDHFWHENPEMKRGSHVWMTDFVGFLPMPSGGDHEAFLTADYNAEMIEHIARYPRIRDRAVFVGGPDDVIPESFGPDLPKIRDWTEEHFDFCGYITGFQPPTPDEVAAWRSDLGYDDDEKVCVVTVGGSGVGGDLLEKVIAAYPMAKARLPELRMVVVAGPRIDPESLPPHQGLEVHGYVDRLYRHLSVCDLAVVQGGLTTTMELTAARRPFLYFPLRNHFEQNYHVRHRLDRHGAGRYMEYATTDPDQIAEAILAEIGRQVDYVPVETDGAARAAAMIVELI